ncbi:MAG: twin-arginine translocation pathway signal protein, partial [Planctomycetota bacterium]
MKHGSQGPTRRSILVNGVRLSALGALAPHAFAERANMDDAKNDRVLVVLQLTGGNDGLNTVAPHGQDEYYRLRPTLAHAPGSVQAHLFVEAMH